jgi:hypothetical protein
MKYLSHIICLLGLINYQLLNAQDVINQEVINQKGMLLASPLAQFEATSAINDMYNFKFEKAKNQFLWFKEKYPNHPMPDFLLGLNEWWQIMPNLEDKSHDDVFFGYMEASIEKARLLIKKNEKDPEAAFFLAAAYGFKGRLHGERKHWTKAALNGKSALNYLKIGKESEVLTPELKFGDALYNYYSIWIRENYPLLKPVMMFFKKGEKSLGLKQLEEVAGNAYYTRTEAQLFLMRIYRNDEKRPDKALAVSAYLAKTFPDNAYFQRYYAGLTYQMGMLEETEKVSKQILQRIETKQAGYEAVSGRYAAFFMGYLARIRYGNLEEAKKYYQQSVAFAESTKSYDSGYYLASLQDLGQICHTQKDFKNAQKYYQTLKKYSKRKSAQKKEARKHLREYRNMDFEE